jgi:hypothetical protein
MRKAILLVLTLCLVDSSLAARKDQTLTTTLTVRALACPAMPHETTVPRRTGGYGSTSCPGTGLYGGYSSPLDFNCQSLHTPPQLIHITIQRVMVHAKLEGDGNVYTVACTAHWTGSGCGRLIPGDTFGVEVKGTTMWVNAPRDGNTGKPIRAKYRILDVRPMQ